MGAHIANEFPELSALTADEITAALSASRLSATDREIAAQRLIWRMPYIDIAVHHHYDRTTVAKRMRRIIIPALITIAKRKTA